MWRVANEAYAYLAGHPFKQILSCIIRKQTMTDR